MLKVGDMVLIKDKYLVDAIGGNVGTLTRITPWFNGNLYEIDYSYYATENEIELCKYPSCESFTETINLDIKENGEIKQEEEKEMKNEITVPITLKEYEMLMEKREKETKEKLDNEFAKRREEFNKKQEKKVILDKLEDERGVREILIDVEKLLKEMNKLLDK